MKDKSKEEVEQEINRIYIQEVFLLAFNKVVCPGCKSIGNFEAKGYYYRTIIINNYRVRIKVFRIKCKDCGKTHAIFFLDFVPYYQLSSLDTRIIIRSYLDESKYDIDLVSNLKKRLHSFKVKARPFGISLKDSIIDITTKLIKARYNSYLQIHKGIVLLN